jgi:hypothetical protein
MKEIKKVLFKTKCFACKDPVEIKVDERIIDNTYMIYTLIAKEKNWAFSWAKGGVFICCQECYPVCFDTSVGSVGFLKEEYNKYRIELD